MPHTYRTFMIATAALIGIFPFAGFWSKDEILAGASQLGGGGNYTRVHGRRHRRGVHDRRLHDPGACTSRSSASTGATGHPHESGPRIVVPLWILAVLGVVAGLANLPAALGPDGVELRFEHFYEPKGAYFPSALPNFAHPEFSLGIALGGHGHRPHRHRARPTSGTGEGRAARHHRAQPRRPGRLHGAREQVLLRQALHRRHRRRLQGPDRPGGQLVQPERARRRGQRRRASSRPSSAASSTPHRPAGGRRRDQRLRQRRPTRAARSSANSRPARCSSTAPCSSGRPPCSPAPSSSSSDGYAKVTGSRWTTTSS